MKPHRFEHGNKANLVSEDRRMFQPPEEIIERAGVGSEIVADLGCGNGYLTIPLSAVAKEVVAIDAQREMLEDLMRRMGDRVGVVRPVIADIPSIPLKDGSVDRLFVVNFLHELQDKATFMDEMHRVLRLKGRVSLVDFQKKVTKMGPPFNERIAEEDVPSLFRGFELIKRFSFEDFYQFEFMKL